MKQVPHDSAKVTIPRLVVPAYFRPDAFPEAWESMAAHAAKVRSVILNLANGPGPEPDPAFSPAVARLRAAGVAVVGYVDTNYGRRSGHEALADLDRFQRWYDVAGVCFDRVSVSPEDLPYYAALARSAREMGGGLVVFNHGAHPLEAYAEHAMDAWDIAAGQLILEESGGTLTTFDGSPHRSADRADVVASNGLIHQELLTVLKGNVL